MTQTTYPSFGYNAGVLTDTEYERWIDGGMTDGVFGLPSDNSIVYADSSGRQVKFRGGADPVFVRGKRWATDTDVIASIAANASGSTRVDLATLRLTRSTGLITPNIITGTPGSGAPAPVQNASGAGVWDYPCAQVTVPSGAVTIAAGQVLPVTYCIVGDVLAGKSNARPPHRYGRIFMDETGTYQSNGSTWNPINKVDSGTASMTAASGWALNWGVVRKIDGIVTMQLTVHRTGGTLAASTNSNIATVPAGYRPDRTVSVIAYQAGGHAMLARVNSAGTVYLEAYGGSDITVGDTVDCNSASWWAA